MINVLFAAGDARWEQYRETLPRALADAGLAADVGTDHPPGSADYVVCAPDGPVADFSPFVRAKAVLSLWAGVEKLVGNPTISQPFCRMADPALKEGMAEWVVGHALRHHLGMDAHISNTERAWAPKAPPLARDRRASVLGLGELGAACAQVLAALNFDVAGWSRRPKKLSGVTCHAGEAGLDAALARADILVLLLPLTAATESILDAARLSLLPEGATVLNPGRGGLIDDDALLAALDSGRLAHATLDVFRVEPLPQDHPFWAHPKVTVTPHVAAETRPASASRAIAENIRRSEAGEPLLNLVDRASGY